MEKSAKDYIEDIRIAAEELVVYGPSDENDVVNIPMSKTKLRNLIQKIEEATTNVK